MNLSDRSKVWITSVSILALAGLLSAGSAPLLAQSGSNTDAALAAVRRQDRVTRNANGVMTRLTPDEHLRRAAIYLANRAFDEAREHWQALINYYPNDPRVAQALLGMGRAYFQSRRYLEAYAASLVPLPCCDWVELQRRLIVTFNTSIVFPLANELTQRTSTQSTP